MIGGVITFTGCAYHLSAHQVSELPHHDPTMPRKVGTARSTCNGKFIGESLVVEGMVVQLLQSVMAFTCLATV
jgi:hypothetical protein